MEQSILKSTKKALNVSPDDPSFDLDIITAINTEFSTLSGLGLGPAEGFVIEDDEPVWEDFLPGDKVQLSQIKTAVFLKARLLFDPPASQFLMEATQNQLAEAEWRLNTHRESQAWVDPTPVPPSLVEEVFDIDGGTAD